MSPTQPHTITKNARTCESCHSSSKALGLGIGSTRPWNEDITVDIETVDGEILPKKTQVQLAGIENLDHDWSQIVTAEGEQVATVGHHFKLSRAMNRKEIELVSRQGTCTACHVELPKESLATSLLHHVAKYTGQLPETTDEHNNLLHKIVLSSAWAQVLLGAGVLGLIIACLGLGIRRAVRRRGK